MHLREARVEFLSGQEDTPGPLTYRFHPVYDHERVRNEISSPPRFGQRYGTVRRISPGKPMPGRHWINFREQGVDCAAR